MAPEALRGTPEALQGTVGMERSMNHRVRVRRMLEWLTFQPTLDKVVRSLVLDSFQLHGPIESTVWQLNDRDALTCLAHYGPTQVNLGVPMSGEFWRGSPEFNLLSAQGHSRKSVSWSEDGRAAVVNLYAQSMLIGFLTLRFPDAVENRDLIGPEIEEFSLVISLYIALKASEAANSVVASHNGKVTHTRNGKPNLTQRQREVLAGIVKKKTNNAIARELGYSVSTIRHETMRIFEILGVSNRIEAASHATALGLE